MATKRTSTEPESKTSHQVHLLVSRSEHQMLKQIALDHETTVSDLLREALAKHVFPLAKQRN